MAVTKTKRYSAPRALGLGNMSPDMTKQQKDQVERMTDAKIEKHFKPHPELPNGRNFHVWGGNNDPEAEEKYRNNFDRIFPNAPGAGF